MSERKHIQAHEVMTNLPLSIDSLLTVRETLKRMCEGNVCFVKIKCRTGNESSVRSPNRTNVHESMLKLLHKVYSWMKIKHAIRLLSNFGLSRRLMVDKNGAIDVMTFRDLGLRHSDIMDRPQHGTDF